MASIVAIMEEGGANRWPHKGQSADNGKYCCNSKSHIFRVVVMAAPGHKKFLSILTITTSPDRHPIRITFEQILTLEIEEEEVKQANFLRVPKSHSMHVLSSEPEIALCPSGVIEMVKTE